MNDERLKSFLERTKVDKTTGCRLWTGAKDSGGYGQFRENPLNTSNSKVHRAAYRHYIGPIPAGQLVLHTCGNRHCVEPQHLTLGTFDDVHANRKHVRHITKQQAEQMAHLRETQCTSYKELARQFNCGASTVPRKIAELKSGHLD